MKVRVLYFAVLRELVGKGEETLELPSEVRTIAELSAHLERTHEPLRGRLGSVRLARNQEFARDADEVGEGDEIALIPPVAGG